MIANIASHFQATSLLAEALFLLSANSRKRASASREPSHIFRIKLSLYSFSISPKLWTDKNRLNVFFCHFLTFILSHESLECCSCHFCPGFFSKTRKKCLKSFLQIHFHLCFSVLCKLRARYTVASWVTNSLEIRHVWEEIKQDGGRGKWLSVAPSW